MRYLTISILTLCLAYTPQASAQVLDNDINFQIWVENFWSNADNDQSDEDDLTIATAFFSKGVWSDIYCKHWQCNAPCINSEDLYLGGALFVDFDEAIKIGMAGWENDGGDVCIYDPGVDDFLFYGEYDALPYCRLTYNREPGSYYADYNPTVNGNWLFPNTSNFDIVIKTIWRYSRGYACFDPLQFGTIPNGQSRTHQNANRSALTALTDYPTGYTDLQNDPSPDVYYSFTITETAEVTISTDNAVTDFDTRLYLYGNDCSANALIAENDDVSTENLRSQLTRVLCPGTYRILVEGYSSNEGYFMLTVEVEDPEIEGFDGLALIDPDCPAASNGMIDLGQPVGGGGPPYSIYWQNGQTGLIATNLSAGVHFVTVTDACNHSIGWSFVLHDEDNTPPVALCQEEVAVDLPPSGTATLTADDIDNGSYDNCGIMERSLSQETFTAADLGLNEVELTIVDESGNSNSCIAIVDVRNATATLDRADQPGFSLYPNPSSGWFELVLEDADWGREVQLEILDLNGRLVLADQLKSGAQRFDLSHLPAGAYWVRCSGEKGQRVERLILQ